MLQSVVGRVYVIAAPCPAQLGQNLHPHRRQLQQETLLFPLQLQVQAVVMVMPQRHRRKHHTVWAMMRLWLIAAIARTAGPSVLRRM